MKEFGFNDQIKNLKGNLDCSMKSGYVSKGKDQIQIIIMGDLSGADEMYGYIPGERYTYTHIRKQNQSIFGDSLV